MVRVESIIGILDELLAAAIVAGVIAFALYYFNVLSPTEALVIFLILTVPLLFLARKLIEAQEQKVKVGVESYVGKEAEVAYIGKKLYVNIEGELWPAESKDELREGDRVVVTGRANGKLRVRKI